MISFVGLIYIHFRLPCGGDPDCVAALTSSSGLSLKSRGDSIGENNQWSRTFDEIGKQH